MKNGETPWKEKPLMQLKDEKPVQTIASYANLRISLWLVWKNFKKI